MAIEEKAKAYAEKKIKNDYGMSSTVFREAGFLDLTGDNRGLQTHRAIEDAEFQIDLLIKALASIKAKLKP